MPAKLRSVQTVEQLVLDSASSLSPGSLANRGLATAGGKGTVPADAAPLEDKVVSPAPPRGPCRWLFQAAMLDAGPHAEALAKAASCPWHFPPLQAQSQAQQYKSQSLQKTLFSIASFTQPCSQAHFRHSSGLPGTQPASSQGGHLPNLSWYQVNRRICSEHTA